MGLELNEIGGGAKSFSPETIGDKISGRIRLVERRQQRSFDGGTPLTWDDGSPRMLTYLEIETDLRVDDEDDGVRALYAKGGRFDIASGSGQALEAAIVEAVRAAGCKSIDEGATLTVAFTGLGKATTRGFQPPKLWKARYEAPRSSVSTDELFGDD
jgi:hypothetical protein